MYRDKATENNCNLMNIIFRTIGKTNCEICNKLLIANANPIDHYVLHHEEYSKDAILSDLHLLCLQCHKKIHKRINGGKIQKLENLK